MSEGTLRVIVAGSAGTCFGVERAIRIAEEERQPILGPLVHNPQIVSDLAAKGIRVFERYHDIGGLRDLREVIITAHGYPKEMKKALEDRGIRIHDATCPILSNWVYRKIQRYEDRGYHIVLIGNPEHAEVIATRSHGKRISVVYNDEDVAVLPEDLEPAVAICQTTLTEERFRHLVDLIRKTRAPSLEADDTRCKPVRKQQEDVDRLARRVDAMIVIGGLNSSNTTNLARIAQEHLPRTTYHVDSPEMVKPEFFEGIGTLGIGAGTSTPRSQIEAVKKRIAEIYTGEVIFEEGG